MVAHNHILCYNEVNQSKEKHIMKPNYIAKKSAFSVITFWRIIACILIIPLFVLIGRIIAVKKYQIEFYDDKIIIHSGLLSKKSKQIVFMGVTGTSVNQSLKGRIFNYGDVSVDCVGKWDVDTNGIKRPKELESYLQTKIVNGSAYNQFIHV